MIFAVSAGMPLHAASSEKKENKTVASEDALPSLALDGLPDVWIQGTPVKEWEKDKVYIFEFWATWCGPCLAAMPHMEQLHQAFKNNPHMQVIGVNVMDRKSPESLKEFFDGLEKIAEKNNVHFYISINGDETMIPEFIQKYI